MATGFLSAGVCHETLAEAVDLYFSTIPVARSTDSAGNTVQISYVYQSPNWFKQFDQGNLWWTAAPVLTVAVPPQFPACLSPSEAFMDGQSIGISILGVCVAAWSVAQLRRIIR